MVGPLFRSVSFCLLVGAAGALAGCTSDYSPNTYASSAVQQANKVEPAVVVGFRQVAISANGTVGAVSGGAAGGILGAQVGTGGINSALGTVGGTAVGSLLGTAMEHIAGDTTGWEYIVRKSNGELLSLTQKEPTPLPIGQKVLVITGSQARIVPDYSTPLDPAAADAAKAEAAKPQTGKAESAKAEPPKSEDPKPEAPKAEPAKSDIKAVPLDPPAESASTTSSATSSATPPATGGGPVRLSAPTENAAPPPAPTPAPATPPTAPAEGKPAE